MIDKIIDKIKENKRFLITAHVNLEGDALGSELGMYFILKKLAKHVEIYNNDHTPTIYNFLPGKDVITHTFPNNNFDAAFILDCSDVSRTGSVKSHLSKIRYLINIDHHPSNTYFGDLNWIDPVASSTAEMIYKLAHRLGVVDKNIALCLYTGIFTDTGGFTYNNITPNVHRIVAELLKTGIPVNKIHTNLNSFCSLKDLKFISRLLSGLKIDYHNNISWILAKSWPSNNNFDLTEVIFSMMRLLKDIEVFILFKKIGKKKVRVNFRSRTSKVDVNKIAKFFGGGGHKSASGTTMDMDIERAEEEVISFIRRRRNGRLK